MARYRDFYVQMSAFTPEVELLPTRAGLDLLKQLQRRSCGGALVAKHALLWYLALDAN